MDFLQRQLDSKIEIAQARNDTTLEWHGKMNDAKERWEAQMLALQRENAASLDKYREERNKNYSDLIDVKRRGMEASADAAGARTDAAAARLG